MPTKVLWIVFVTEIILIHGQDLPLPPGPGLDLPGPGNQPDIPLPGIDPLPVPPVLGPELPGVPLPGVSSTVPSVPDSIGTVHFTCNGTVNSCKKDFPNRVNDATCYCDEFCRIMNDCCDDFEQKIYTKLTDRRREILKKLECSGVDKRGRKLRHYPSGYLMMKSCPNSYPRDMIKYLCETEGSTDTFRLWPVSSKTTGIFYKNMFCSMCWEDTDVLYWAVELQCIKEEDRKDEIKDAKHKIEELSDAEGHCGDRSENQKNLMACRKLTGFLNPFNCIDVSFRNLRDCSTPYVSTCSASWPNTAIEEECISHTERVSVVSGDQIQTVYKNYHCGLCNFKKADELKCLERELIKEPTATKGLAVLFDAEIGCEDNEIYDVFARRCRPLFCHEGQTLETDRCSWSDTNRTDCALVRLNADEYKLYNNGTVLIYKSGIYVNASNYDISNDTVLFCSDILGAEKEDLITASGMVTVISLSISIICLFLLFMVYLVLPSLRNVPGKILMSLTFALFWAQIFFLVGIERTEIPELCIAFAMLIHYFFLASFAWMTMMAMDMALTFRPMNLHGTGASKKNRFLYVSLYAWCFPVVIVVPGIVMDQFIMTDPFNPGYGQGGSVCWFSNRMALIIFFLVPCAAHLLVNFICYIYTVYNIAVVSKLAKKVKTCDKCNLFLYFKLSVIMGGTWVLAYVWILTRNDVIEFAFIILNGCQGLFLFLAFVCRTRTWHQLRKRELTSTTNSRSTHDTSMSLRYRNASYKFKHDRPTTLNSSSQAERQRFI